MNPLEQLLADMGLLEMSLPDSLGIAGSVLFIILSLINLRSSKKEDAPKLEAKVEDPKAQDREELKDNEPQPVIEKIEEKKVEVKEPKQPVLSFSKRLMQGLSKTRGDIWDKVGSLMNSGSLDEEQYEQVEEILYSSDLSPMLVDELLESLKKSKDKEKPYNQVVREFIESKMKPVQETINPDLYSFDRESDGLKVIMIVGVNGAGKTTTIGKLATRLKNSGAKVVVGACDTFRAAAVEQLEVWCKRADVEMVKAPDNTNPTGVAYDTVQKAKEIGADYCLIDTAGRLHTASNLMDELAKTKKVMSKVVEKAPHETLLVVDAITGQNAIRQAQEFNQALNLSGLIFTKCDGSSKAGSAVSIVDRLQVPITYIGVGEGVEDLDVFKLDEYLDALLTGEA